MTPDELDRVEDNIPLGVKVAARVSMLGLLVMTTLYGAWVLTKLWAWFFVPYGVPTMSLRFAVGVMMVLSVLFTGVVVLISLVRTELGKQANTGMADSLALAVLFCIGYSMALACGFFYHMVL